MFIQAENAILNLNHVVEFLPSCGERTYSEGTYSGCEETYLRFNINGSEIGFIKLSDMEYQLAVMVNGSKHLVLSAAIHACSAIVGHHQDNSLDKIREEYKLKD